MIIQRRVLGLSRAETLVVIAIVAIVVVILVPIWSAKGIGHKTMMIHFEGKPAKELTVRVALIRQIDADVLLSTPSHLEVNWQSISADEADVELSAWFATDTPFGVLFCYPTKRYQLQDAVAVEYRIANKAPRFRVIPFELPHAASTVEITIPREPSNNAEGWRPK